MIVFMGVAGAGKSLQGRRLADEMGLPWLSTGEFLRMLVTGARRKEMLEGKLLSDSEVIALADKIFHLIEADSEYVLDGFPRTLGQADWLIAQHNAGLQKISAVIHIEASEKVVAERLLQRGRPDDTKEAISFRFKEFSATTLPIIKDFESNNIPVHRINGDQDPESVYQDILKVVK
jgi:adenylate kinase